MSVPERLGDFEIAAEIGRGGFGIVYRAKQVSLHRDVALKVLYEHRVHTSEEVGRFEREARAAARLDHPALVQVYAWGQDKGHFFIAQKLVGEGRTLADSLEELKRGGDPPKGYFRDVAETLAHVADGLNHAHEEGIVHRDMKPSNILLDDKARAFLGDFGLAKVEDGLELSRTGDFAGSPYYMSPEQADSRRGEVDSRADIYGMGVTLYELLTLKPPFEGQSPHEIIRRILTEEPKPPSKVVDRVPKDLETICLKAMEKARVRRYQTAAEFAADLRAFLDGEPISAVPISTVSRIWRTARRNRAGVGIVVLVAALLAVSAVFEKNRRTAQEEQHRTHQQGEVIQDVVGEVSEQREEVGMKVDELFTEALQSDRPEDALKLQAFKGDVSRWLDAGQQLLMDVIPEISDDATLENLETDSQDQSLFETVRQVEEYLAAHPEGDEPDPRLAQAKEWLANAGMLQDAASGLDSLLGEFWSGLGGPGEGTPAVDLGDVAQVGEAGGVGPPAGPAGALSNDDSSGPPLGPGGALGSPPPATHGSGGDGSAGDNEAQD
jgi:hypothetical protein